MKLGKLEKMLEKLLDGLNLAKNGNKWEFRKAPGRVAIYTQISSESFAEFIERCYRIDSKSKRVEIEFMDIITRSWLDIRSPVFDPVLSKDEADVSRPTLRDIKSINITTNDHLGHDMKLVATPEQISKICKCVDSNHSVTMTLDVTNTELKNILDALN